MYAAWDDPKQKTWLSQVISVNNDHTYNLFYADGDVRDDVPENQIRRPTKRQLTDKLVGKKFFDPGDIDLVKKRRGRLEQGEFGRFKKGEFVVILREVTKFGVEPSYWCERDTFGDKIQEKRHIELFGSKYVTDLIDEYDDE